MIAELALQLLATPGLHTLSLENSKSVPDEGDSAKRKGEEQKNRNSHKQADPDAEPLDNTSTEV